MADYAAGVTASWRGTTLGEVTELRVDYGGGLPIARGPTVTSATAAPILPWSFDLGTIDVVALGTAGFSVTEWGQKGSLVFGGAAGLSTKAICQTLQITGKLQDVWRYQGTFKIVRE